MLSAFTDIPIAPEFSGAPLADGQVFTDCACESITLRLAVNEVHSPFDLGVLGG